MNASAGVATAALALALGAAGGCSSSSSAPVPNPPVDAGSLEVEPGVLPVAAQTMKLVADGDAVALWNAPQGGHVLLVGASVRGLSGTVATFHGKLREVGTDALVTEEKRTVALVPAADGSGALVADATLPSQFANVAVCPDGAGRAMLGPYVLELTVSDPYDGRTASVRRTVTPSCAAVPESDLARCTCECAAAFSPGKCAK